MTLDEVESVLAVHLRGGFHVALPGVQGDEGAGVRAPGVCCVQRRDLWQLRQANYGAAKMGLVGFSNVLAIEGAKYGIRSKMIAPVARTRMTKDLLGPMAEFLDPEQVTPTLVYLASEGNPHTHEIFTAGGGRYGKDSPWVPTHVGSLGRRLCPPSRNSAEHIEEVRDLSTYEIPLSSNDEIRLVMAAMQDG